MHTRKLVLRYLVVLQVYQGVHLVRSNQDADAASIPAKLCLPYDKSELERYLKKLDTPEVSMSNIGSSLSVKDTESLPFGALPVDWRRLRLLNDLSTVPKPGIEKISSDEDFTGVSEEEAFLTTGNIRVPDETKESTTHVRLHRSTLNNRNGNIDSTTMTVEPDTFDGWEEEVPSVTESETGIDIEENSGLTEIPMFEEVEKSIELITTDANSNPTTTPLTTVFKNTDSLIEEIATTEEIKPKNSSKNYEEESTDRQKFESFSSTTESSADPDIGTTKMTVILKIGEPFSSVPKFVEHYGDREANKNRVSRVRNFGQKSRARHSQNIIDSGEDEALAKTRLSVFEPFDLGKKLRNRRPSSRHESEGLVKRGWHNTNTEKLFRWFYRGDLSPDNSGKTDAEIKCVERS